MIDRAALLSDLQSLLKKLEADLLERTDSDEVPEVGEWLRAEYQQAKDAERTAHTYKQWLDDFITQVAAAWVLSCVFARFLEDNELVDPPRMSGVVSKKTENRQLTTDNLSRARDEHELYFCSHPTHTDREYLLDIFAGLAQTAAGKDLFGQHNPMNALPNWLGPDAAGELLRFFQKIDSDSGALVHDFTDPPQEDGTGWDTRFLGDLYQDVSEAARKKYALLQTPDFVEEFILDRTLDPALDEFGLDAPAVEDSNGKPITEPGFRMIDPACGSGHFLLGSFPRILDRWQRKEPETNVRELVQRTLDSIHGVDINPFAIAIARFRLLLAAFKACGIKRLKDAPKFEMNLACGDSLYHGRQQQMMLGDWTDESHYFHTEDAGRLTRILVQGTFHAVVANPPYITPKDKAANKAYRQLYSRSCHGKYPLAAPFMERIFSLAIGEVGGGAAGFAGQITANSFMKREFGKKLIEQYLAKIDLTHVIDASVAYIPGHGTPTTIMIGRNQKPVASSIRVVMGITGEPTIPDDPSQGVVWLEILDSIDRPETQTDFLTVKDTDRKLFEKHPWSIGGGGASELKEVIDKSSSSPLNTLCSFVGVNVAAGEDDAYFTDATRRARLKRTDLSQIVSGEMIRDWRIDPPGLIMTPYDKSFNVGNAEEFGHQIALLWPTRQLLKRRKRFGVPMMKKGAKWYEWQELYKDKQTGRWSICTAEVATHNHFAITSNQMLFKNTAQVVKLADTENKRLHIDVLCVLNSSTVAFWLKQVCFRKGGSKSTDGARLKTELWTNQMQFNSTNIGKTPIPSVFPNERFHRLYDTGHSLDNISPVNVIQNAGELVELQSELASSKSVTSDGLRSSIRLQEDLDWECYRLYGLLEEDLTYGEETDFGISLGERAFEIVLARKIAQGEVKTMWFERHGSTPITEIPEHWPDDYKQLVQRRIDVIETNKNIALIEQPEYKRRWNTEPWESQVERALKSWLLDRLESYFDFDGRMNDEGTPTAKIDISLTSVAKLADIARQDEQFMEVAEVYRDDPAFDVQKLVEELVKGEHVPLLPVLRYKPNGLRNRVEWEKTWELQRLEDRLSDQLSVISNQLKETKVDNEKEKLKTEHCRLTTELAELDIPVPPKYKSSDFISTGGARYWKLRGKLDVPKERWVSFPHCEGPDGTLVIAWAGYDHLQLAQAISAYYVDVQERLGGRDDPRLVPLLAGIIELLPWLKQWHHDIDPEYNQRMDEVFEGFVTEEAKGLGMTIDEIKAWQPPQRTGGRRRRASS